ncbi:hypothetical protein GOV11_04645 [Candidatus Woesearchaeota archaeon]|nr:hypothetical protein [Candidatus Woesearchaeota archaeon]
MESLERTIGTNLLSQQSISAYFVNKVREYTSSCDRVEEADCSVAELFAIQFLGCSQDELDELSDICHPKLYFPYSDTLRANLRRTYMGALADVVEEKFK